MNANVPPGIHAAPGTTTGTSSARTTLLGGAGILLATVYPLVGTILVVWPGIPGAQLVSWMIFAIACGLLAFGVPGETGIVGDSTVGRVALFAFGVHRLVLDVASLLTPIDSYGPPNLVLGWVNESVVFVGLLGGAVAAIVIVRAGILHGPARWALIPFVVVEVVSLGLLFARTQEIALVGAGLGRAAIPLLALVGVAYALHGRWPAIRRWLARVNDAW